MSGAAEIAAKLTALAERCEAATGGDARTMRALGREVLLACGKGYVSPLFAWRNPVISLDAALTLVPDGADYTIEPDACWLRFPDPTDDDGIGEVQSALIGQGGRCTALALCAAALRARAHLSRESGE